jgi:hypothetical protein
MSIAEVIGWKFDYQQGMSTRDNVITEFPGGIPSQVDQDKWTAEYLVQFPEGYDEWKSSMQETDLGMPRYLEDHITDDHDGVAGNEFLQAKYDDKKALRATKP